MFGLEVKRYAISDLIENEPTTYKAILCTNCKRQLVTGTRKYFYSENINFSYNCSKHCATVVLGETARAIAYHKESPYSRHSSASV